MKKIVMFIGGIETQAYFSLQMKKAFEELGHEVCVFDYEKAWNTLGDLMRFCGNGNTVMVTFNFHGICGDQSVRINVINLLFCRNVNLEQFHIEPPFAFL